MTKITRRSLLALSGSAIGLGACAPGPGARRGASGEYDPFELTYEGDVTFEHGVASGDPLPDAVILWTRVTRTSGAGPIPVSWTVFEGGPDGDVVSTGYEQTTPARDDTVKVDVDGLKAGTEYHFKFAVAGTGGEINSPMGRTKTAPAKDSDDALRFVFISCSNYPFGYFNAYREIARQDDLDAIIHLGDYFYEYGVDGYGGSAGEGIGRRHEPITEIVTLDDYRTRHAQYKADADLQAAHATAPWLCTWDDHESTNNSYRTGAQNHNPENNEGDWTERRQKAVQAYLEWMPVRDPKPGRAREAIYRRFEFGTVATVFCLESRLTGRSDEISWLAELSGVEPVQLPLKAMSTMARVQDDGRTMLGQEQENWLADGLEASVEQGTQWQVLANQVVMARVVPPAFNQTLTDEQIDGLGEGFGRLMVDFSVLRMPSNLDAWDGFPAARARLYDGAEQAGARLVTLTGDTHTAWANTLRDVNGNQRGVEFGCTSVTSPGMGTWFPGVDDLGAQFVDANPEVDYHDPHGNGFTLLTLTPSGVRADFVKVSTIREKDYSADVSSSWVTRADGDGMTPLSEV
ncbi:MAG: alkaline phosphatase D family protein [Pseudomonadota bacterium]